CSSDLFPAALRKTIAVISYALCLGFAVFSTYWGFILVAQNYMRLYTTLKISYSFATAAIPIVSCIMILTLVEQLINVIKDQPIATETEEADSENLLEVGS
ncbi:MAG: TRAP transporter small permease subunit, partial [Clostridiales Family XIII bacterium]|nr:TRAP transporter small permease subunit [Clostridiales Family XIII bacterium]